MFPWRSWRGLVVVDEEEDDVMGLRKRAKDIM
jgi:hypothetical protein